MDMREDGKFATVTLCRAFSRFTTCSENVGPLEEPFHIAGTEIVKF